MFQQLQAQEFIENYGQLEEVKLCYTKSTED